MKSLLVHADGTPRFAVRLKIASDLARRHESRLTALFAVTPPLLDTAYGPAAETFRLLDDLYVGWRNKAISTFQAGDMAPRTVWSELSGEAVIAGFIRQALFADLMVLGQYAPGDRERQTPADFVSSVLVASGRPAVIVPYTGAFEGIGIKVLVAWKASAESARALAAALPLLRRAHEVNVVEWGHAPDDCRGEALDIERYCRLHGVQATVHRHADEPDDLGELLLSRAADFSADLLVMGCYGHSRAREFVLGGVTRTVLATMTLPVLMSH